MARARGDRRFYLPIWYGGMPEERTATRANTYVRAEGMTITLADGTSLEDWSGAAFVNNVGMGRPDMGKVLAEEASRISWVGPAEFAEVRLALTQDLRGVLPRHLTIPFFGIGGSDSVEAAIRAARKVTRRKKVLTFTAGYHGDTMTVESVSGTGVSEYGDPRPWTVHTISPYDAFQETGDWADAGERTLEGIRARMKRHGPRSFACVLLEPVMGVAGAVPFSQDVGRELRELCDRHDIKLVADEVITGLGRTGDWWRSPAIRLNPDAIVLAKGLTGGYAPLGAVVFERSWGEALRRSGFPHGLTFGGHPIACAAARETIRILKSEGLVERCRSMGRSLRRRLEELKETHPAVVRDVRGAGLLLAMELRSRGRGTARSGLHPAWKRVEPIWTGLWNAGIRVTTNHDGSSILLCPPFTVTEGAINRLVHRLDFHLHAA